MQGLRVREGGGRGRGGNDRKRKTFASGQAQCGGSRGGLGNGVQGQIAILEVGPQAKEAHVLKNRAHLVGRPAEGAAALATADIAEQGDERTDELRAEVLAMTEVDDEIQ